MKSQFYTWLTMALCLAALLAAMGWISLTLLRLDAQEAAARREAARQEHIRLAMWRLEVRACDLLETAAAPPSPTSRPDPAPVTVADTLPWWPQLRAPDPRPDADGLMHPDANAASEQELRNSLEEQARRDYVQQRLPSLAIAWSAQQPVVVLGSDRWLPVAQMPLDALRASVTDLLPDARLEPIEPTAAGPAGLTLHAAPLRLEPGDTAFYYQRPFSPIRLMLLIAWSCILLPSVGVVLLLFVMASLSERRAAFVSAVTHELRTPLTTFRMYTDMLADGMVAEDRRPDYLRTLQREAARLSHLVDNVLTYARLERGRAREALEAVRLQALLDRCQDELRVRCERAGMTLEFTIDAALRQTPISVDAAAAERILANLVDNACKYADAAADRRIVISAERRDGTLDLRVRDFGPGLPAGARRAFRPFTKLRDADQQKPGIGLGLALCERLASRMRGKLRHEPANPGACFVLSLALAEEVKVDV